MLYKIIKIINKRFNINFGCPELEEFASIQGVYADIRFSSAKRGKNPTSHHRSVQTFLYPADKTCVSCVYMCVVCVCIVRVFGCVAVCVSVGVCVSEMPRVLSELVGAYVSAMLNLQNECVPVKEMCSIIGSNSKMHTHTHIYTLNLAGTGKFVIRRRVG